MSPKSRRKVKHQTPVKKNKNRRERAVPQPNVVVGSNVPSQEEKPVAAVAEKTPVSAAASPPSPETARVFSVVDELKRVGILGAGMAVVLVVMALILG